MRPQNLIISGWGPYKDKIEIHFDAFGQAGLFLITGATGAGKTTIFDAITYALFGEVNGTMRSKDSVRSDFAEADTKTYVTLNMTHKEELYVITRNPQYVRPKKRKGGSSEYTKEMENAVLTLPDGSVIEGNKEVNHAIQEILKMNHEQFTQISMIAQGEFTKLLTASSKEKTQIFRTIFGTHIYEKFAVLLHQQAGTLYHHIMVYRNKMDETIDSLLLESEEFKNLTSSESKPYERIRDYLAEQAELEKSHKKEIAIELEQVDKRILAQEKKIQKSKNMNQMFLELEQAEQRKQELMARKESILLLKKNLQSAVNAQAVSQSAIHKHSAQERLQETQEKLNKIELAVKRLEAEKEKNRLQFSNQEEVQATLRNLEDLLQEMTVCQREEETLLQKQDILKQYQKEYLEIEKCAVQDKCAQEQADQRYRHAIVGIVAAQVRKGVPCPVCGALEHPRVANMDSEVPSEASMQALKEQAEKSSKQLLDLQGKTSAYRGEVEAQLRCVEEHRRTICQKEQTSCRISDIISVLVLALLQESEYSIPQLLAQNPQVIGSRIEEALQRQHVLCTHMQQIQAELVSNKQRFRETLEEQTLQTETWKQAAADYQKQLLAYGFQSEEQFVSSQKTPEDIEEMRQIIGEYEQQVVSNTDYLMRMRASVKGKTQVILEEIQAEQQRNQLIKKELQKSYNQVQIMLAGMEQAYVSLRDKLQETVALEKRYGVVKDLDNLTQGLNPKRMVFEQFVLISYFEQVLEAANLRLYKMTAGRYELSRAEGMTDGRTKDNFEIQVLDHYTGRYRLAKTLSGGEIFKASLALALGMSDIIQSNSGGVKVETLFIDEGFGSLDSESLDLACETLMMLVEKNRLIGIISHVPELRERIDKQVIVEKTNAGSRIRVVVS
ncbi:MAG: SMC family ATPase [Lachnospiraceae bacterium]